MSITICADKRFIKNVCIQTLGEKVTHVFVYTVFRSEVSFFSAYQNSQGVIFSTEDEEAREFFSELSYVTFEFWMEFDDLDPIVIFDETTDWKKNETCFGFIVYEWPKNEKLIEIPSSEWENKCHFK